MTQPLWTPSPERIQASNLRAFLVATEERLRQAGSETGTGQPSTSTVAGPSGSVGASAGEGASPSPGGSTAAMPPLPSLLDNYGALHRWSVAHKEQFWSAIWDHFQILGDKGPAPWLLHADRMPGAEWFPGAHINYAENLLRPGRDDSIAIIETGEDGRRRELTFAALRGQVARLAHRLRDAGVQPGDRVAAFLPNCAEAVVTLLASASLGAVYSSCSPDFGLQGVIDRFGQINPKVLVATTGYHYAGKRIDTRDRVRQIVAHLGQAAAVQPALTLATLDQPTPHHSTPPRSEPAAPAPLWIEVDYLGIGECQPGALSWQTIQRDPEPDLSFTPRRFGDPLYILYSSGTTGVPKCIVHSIGGALLQHVKELGLHTDLRAGERLFFFTTCGWMMWNWLVSALALGTTIVLFDGSPFHPRPDTLFDLAERERVTAFGAGAKFYAACEKSGLQPARSHDLSPLRTVLSTGSPLSHESFSYIYREIKEDICLSSISGGTDIVSCFALGNPTLPVYQGELQCAGLGMDVAFLDDDGHEVQGEKGELVCRGPFPSMPVGFWADAEQSKFRDAYFSRFPGVWAHGDFGETVEHPNGHRGIIIHGRSDAVLNPGGVRIGTAEIYRQVEKVPAVLESLAIGQKQGDDERIVLFVKLRDGHNLDDVLRQEIRQTIRANTTARHVPAVICQVADLPRTLSGKIVELAVRQIVHGEPVKNQHALANPEALEQFRDRVELG